MNISEQIGRLWKENKNDIGLVWYLLPASDEPKASEIGLRLQKQIVDYLLMTPFSAESGRLVGEQLSQQFNNSLEKLGYLQRLLAEQLLLGLDQTQTAWVAERIATFWAEMTVGFSQKRRKLLHDNPEDIPEKIWQDAESRTHFKVLFDDTYSPVVLHANGRILAVNKAITHVYGYSAEELVGQQIQGLVHTFAPTSEKSKILKHVTAGHPHTYQTKCLHKSGVEVDIEVTANHIIYEGHRVRMIVLRPVGLSIKPTPGRHEVHLTPRQEQVLHYLALGLADKEIAGRLQISLTTVKYHKQAVFKKLQVTTRAEAVIWAWQKSDLFAALTPE
jgi:PAS domain S-box-containing protein